MKKLETILITGGAGFIGSNLCEHFVNEGKRVICLDNLMTGNEANIQNLKQRSNFSFVQGDIRDFDICTQVVKGVDAVSHQAALGSVPRSIENPIPANEINCQGFLNMIEASRKANVKRFVYASSSSVYGDSQQSPKTEDVLGAPLSPYAVSKLTNELYGRIYHQLYGMETIGLRYFNVFGKNQDPNGAYAAAIPKFISLLRKGVPPTIYGDGEQTRDFTYVKNVILANRLALENEDSLAYGQAFNVACGKSYSLNEVIEIIQAELTKNDPSFKSIKPNYEPGRRGDIMNSLADTAKIKRVLGYSPTYDFEQGIAAYIANI